MSEFKEIFEKLAAPFPPEDIQWRVGSTTKDKTKGLALPYVNARAIMERLDSAVGPAMWWDEYRPVERSKGWICRLTIQLDPAGGHVLGLERSREDGADETDIEPTKGGISDAFKRAAVKFGMGRYLYRLPAIWAPLRPAGKSYVLKSYPTLPAWALPGGSGWPDSSIRSDPGGELPDASPPESEAQPSWSPAMLKVQDRIWTASSMLELAKAVEGMDTLRLEMTEQETARLRKEYTRRKKELTVEVQ